MSVCFFVTFWVLPFSLSCPHTHTHSLSWSFNNQWKLWMDDRCRMRWQCQPPVENKRENKFVKRKKEKNKTAPEKLNFAKSCCLLFACILNWLSCSIRIHDAMNTKIVSRSNRNPFGFSMDIGTSVVIINYIHMVLAMCMQPRPEDLKKKQEKSSTFHLEKCNSLFKSLIIVRLVNVNCRSYHVNSCALIRRSTNAVKFLSIVLFYRSPFCTFAIGLQDNKKEKRIIYRFNVRTMIFMWNLITKLHKIPNYYIELHDILHMNQWPLLPYFHMFNTQTDQIDFGTYKTNYLITNWLTCEFRCDDSN